MLHKGRWAFLLTALFASQAVAQERVGLCASCHGPDGNSPDPKIPSIAGQPKLFIETQLVLFREELRKSEPMLPIVRGMKDPEIIQLAQHFSKLPAKGMESGNPDPALMKTGAEKANALRCGICHTADFGGQKQVPRLAAQRETYLEAEMRAYRDGKRAGGDTIMAATLYGVSDADIRALAHFLARSKAPASAR
jgi:cytochrome c553